MQTRHLEVWQQPGALPRPAVQRRGKSAAWLFFDHVKNAVTLLRHTDIYQLILLPYVMTENLLVKCFLGQMLLWD